MVLNSKTFHDAWAESKVFVVDQSGKGFGIDTPSTASQKIGGVGVTPEYRLATALKAIRMDETLYGALVTKVDATVSNGWYLTGTNKQELKRAQALLEKRNFDATLRQLCYSLYSLGNVFVEINKVEEDGEPAVYIVETTQVEIEDEEGHGEASRYTQNISGNQTAYWSPEEIVHFKLDRFDTGLWAEVPIRPLDTYIGLKSEVKKHLYRLFKKNSFRSTILFPEKTVEEDVNRSIAEYQLAAKDPNRPFIWFGGVDQKVLQTFEDGPRFIEIINMCDHAILVQMQVPPIMAGVPDASGRASGEQQTYKAFNTHIRGVQQTVIAKSINSELLPKMGFKSVKFHFNELDSKSEKDIMEMAVQLKALGAKPDKLTNWLQTQGIEVDDDFFNPEFFESPSKMEKNAISNKTAPSRAGANGARKSIGTASESSTRANQLVTQSFDDEEEKIEQIVARVFKGDEE